MPRPPLPIGSHGKIRVYPSGAMWRALTKFRDFDGITRSVERVGKTKAAAQRELKQALTERTSQVADVVSPSTRFREVAEQWFNSVQAAAAQGTRSPTTVDVYRSQLDRHVLPALGELRVQEVTVPRVDSFLSTLRNQSGTATAKTSRTVVSGVLGLAVRHGAISTNPIRETARIEEGPKSAPRALTAAERARFLDQLESDEAASGRDIPDLVRFMLATGARIGEALAVCWPEVDCDSGLVAVNFTVVRVKGKGLVRKSTKSSSGERTLPLPSWAVEMLRQRKAERGTSGEPVFPDSLGGLRDPSNTRRDLRKARGSEEFGWVTSHVFRKTAATILDEAGLSARVVADQLGHSRPSLTQDVYMGRKAVTEDAATALETVFDRKSE
ncbi:tyrosine-type recombinase/integrase [Actinopolyspora saharensis]|uniref:Site-specific recombinase XerD n=1 Tax=Actinopolyspora saharensis TaxID=995062 RepID=A0A1H1G6P9_9ACTN|nr:Site-specific recombinase XerD [Actinopolyspora saharensis]